MPALYLARARSLTGIPAHMLSFEPEYRRSFVLKGFNTLSFSDEYMDLKKSHNLQWLIRNEPRSGSIRINEAILQTLCATASEASHGKPEVQAFERRPRPRAGSRSGTAASSAAIRCEPSLPFERDVA